MSVERVNTNRKGRRRMRGAYGCLFLLLIVMILCVGAVVIILPAAPQIALQIAGFQPAGQTDDLFVNTAPEAIAPSVLDTSNNTSPPRSINASIVTVSSPDIGTTSVDMSPYTVQQFRDAQERETVAVRLSEAELLSICQTQTTLCNGRNDLPVSNLRFDTRPGGAIIYADVTLPELGISQNAGFVVQFMPESARFTIAGVDLDGTLYKSPPETFGISLSELEVRGNNALQQARVQLGGITYGIAGIYADDTSVTIVLR